MHCSYDRSVTFLREEDILVLRLSDGRLASFPVLNEGEDSYNRLERITLSRTKEGYVAFEHDSNLSFHFTVPGKDRGYSIRRLSSVTDLDGRSIRLSYENGVLATLTDACGRRITVRHTDAGFIESLHLRMPDGSSEQLVRYSYDGQGDMVDITDALGQTTGIHYEASLGIVTSVTQTGNPLHNAMAERLNGIIKNDWLYNFEDKPIEEVREILSQTIALYNTARPHRALNKKTPMQMLIPDYPNPLTTQPPKNQISKNDSPTAPSLKTPSPCRPTPNKELSLCTSAVKTTTSRVPQQEQN